MSDAAPPVVFADNDRLAALRLARGAGIGPILYARLIARFGSASRALEALPELAAQTKAKVGIASVAMAEREMAALTKLGGRLIVRGEADYPIALGALADAPTVLSVMGDPAVLQRQCVGIVGARNASISGMKFASLLARDIGRAGYTIVSGLARGIDTAAHRASLDTGTVAAMAGGLDKA